MSAMIATGVFVGAGQTNTVPQQLGAILYIPDLNTPVNGYWQDKSGKGKLVQAATTTVANDSLIMPANDADIIAALTLAGAYSKYYTNNSTPKKVLVSQIASIDSKYAVFFDAKTKTKFSLFKTQGDEARADKMYEFTFKAYTGGYFPITQTSDSVSFVIRGTGTHVFDWGDGTTTSYTLTTGVDTTVSKTWTTNLGGQKNISVTGSVLNWNKLVFNINTTNNSVIRITNMLLITLALIESPFIKTIGSITNMPIVYIKLYSCPLIEISGSITGMPVYNLQLYYCPLITISGSINGKNLITNQLVSCPLITISGSINGMSTTILQLSSCPLIEISGSITGMNLAQLSLSKCPLSTITGNIETCATNISALSVYQNGIIYGGGSLKAWNISITIQANWSSNMVDAFINAFALVAPTVTNKTLNLRGSNAGRTSASDASAAILTSRGFILLTNNGELFEGDSITYGTAASPLSLKWTTLYCQNKGVTELNNGVGGKKMATGTADNPAYITTMINEPEYTVGNSLKLAFGVNDVISNISPSAFIDAYRTALNYLISIKNYPISSINIINIYYTSSLAIRTPAYNSALLTLANEFGIKYIDVFTNCQDGTDVDGVHPDNTRHQSIANYVISQTV